jgi:murein L,D-transpeptidase YcbB/YkuD
MNSRLHTLSAAVLLLFASLVALPWPAAAAPALKDRVERMASARDAPAAAIYGFYAKRDYRPLWFAGGRLAPHGEALLRALGRAEEHGLHPAMYGMPRLADRIHGATGEDQAELELALTRAYLDFAADVAAGTVDNPRRIGRVFRDSRRPDPAQLLDAIARAGDAAAFLATLPPDTRRYDALKSALAKYREIQRSGGWPIVSPGPVLIRGMRGSRVAMVKRRLLVTGELREVGDAELFDDALVAAVKAFQLRHGLADGGSVGPETVAEMNVSVARRIEQIAINLERRRWLAGHLGERYVYLNIADNDLKVVEKDHTVHVARVIVGKPYQQTPVFSATMTHIEINPYWNVPRSIAVSELLPMIRRNPGYLAANDYLLLRRAGDNSSAADPRSIDWSAISARNFPYAIRQLPGAKNALGTLVFRFPNAHNVYLHDTPSRSLFERERRFFSHGCMRVQHPVRLALLLLGRQDGGAWTEAHINAIIATRVFTVVPLQRPIPVHITYLTAWAERGGTVHFRADVYNRDAALKAALAQATRAR